jgi:hypothetical protein
MIVGGVRNLLEKAGVSLEEVLPAQAALPTPAPAEGGEVETVTVYTGSDAPFTKFDVGLIGTRTDEGFAGRGAYTTKDFDKAKRWGKHVMATTIQGGKWIEINKQSELQDYGLETIKEGHKLTQDELRAELRRTMTEFRDRMVTQGYDGVKWTLSSGDVQYVLFDPAKYDFREVTGPEPPATRPAPAPAEGGEIREIAGPGGLNEVRVTLPGRPSHVVEKILPGAERTLSDTEAISRTLRHFEEQDWQQEMARTLQEKYPDASVVVLPDGSVQAAKVTKKGKVSKVLETMQPPAPAEGKATPPGAETKPEVAVITSSQQQEDLLRGAGYSLFEISQMDAGTKSELATEIQRINSEEPPSTREGGFLTIPIDLPGPAVIKEKADSLYRHLINRFQPIEDMVKKAKKLGYTPAPGEDPGIGARRYLGLGRVVEAFLQKHTYRSTKEGRVISTGEGLKPILDDYDKALKPFESNRANRETDLNDYLIAQRTIEDLQRAPYPGAEDIVTPEQVQAAEERRTELFEKYGAKGMAQMEDTAQRLYDYQRRVLHLLVDSGNISQAQYNRILDLNQHYIPFQRILDKAGLEGGVPVSKKRFTKVRAPISRIKGSEKAIEDVVGSVVKNTYRIVDAAMRNTVARDVAKLGKVMPEDISPVRITMVPIRVSPKEILTTVKTFRSKSSQVIEESREASTTGASQSGPIAKLETVVKDALQKRGFSEGESNSFIAQIRKGKTGDQVTTETVKQLVKETEKVLISQQPIESTIFRPSAFGPKGNVIEYYVGGKRKYIEVPQNVYQAMTGLNEAASNLLVNAFSKPAHWLRIGATSTPEFVLRNPIRDQWTALMQTSFGFIPFVDSAGAIADIVEGNDIYYEWMASGAAYSGFVELNRPSLEKVVKELRGTRGQKLLRRLNIISDMQDLSQLMEVATRVGVYKRAKKAGMTSAEAAYEARGATLDFQRKGASTSAINQLTAFFNAGVQATDKTIRTMIHNPGRTAIAGLASITLPSLLLYLLNRDDDKYKEIPRWQKDLFWIFPVGGIYWRVPKPFLYGQLFGSLPERLFEYIDTKDPDAFRDITESLYDSISPVSGEPESALLFTAAKPIIENASPLGYNFFMDRTIIPRGLEDVAASDQYSQYTSESAKFLGKWLNYSPAKIENLIGGYFGGTGRYGLQGTDALLNAIRGQEQERAPRTLADVPLVKGFVVRDPGGRSAESVNRFYADSQTIIQQANSHAKAIKSGNLRRAQELMTKYPSLVISKQLKRYRDTLSSLNKQANIVIGSSLSSEDKQKQLDLINQNRLQIARVGNKLMRDYEK